MSVSYPRVVAVGDRAVTAELGPTLDEETVGRVRALDARLRDRDLAGVLESVPTYAALLVIYDRRQLSFSELSDALLQLAHGLETTIDSGHLVEIPTLYEGEDLAEVADLSGLANDDVVELHSNRDYSVLMLGFSPGFAYMGFVDDRLKTARRRTPRIRVPSGAVAIAGVQTGIYPRALPGGWNLLGRTTLPLFDPLSASPSLLMPGDRVRFRPVLSLEPEASPPGTKLTGSGVTVVEPGILTMVQDAGRTGLRRVAVPWTGYADPRAARLANACVGNPPEAPVIEICGPGLKLCFEKTTFIAISGASVSAELERADIDSGQMTMPANVAVRVRDSNVLTINGLGEGARAYVAIAGLEAEKVLGSASVDRGSGFLRPLRAGDRLAVGAFDSDWVRREPMREPSPRDVVRVIPGPQAHHFDERAIETLLSARWTVGLDSDRVAARLDGPRILHAGPTEIVSDGMVPGCIQVPPDGRPIVMLSDCPTTGGYPKIGCVVSEDIGIIAQAIPAKTPIFFAAVRIEDL